MLNYQHQSALSPYRASHAIYVSRGAHLATLHDNEIAPILKTRLLSVRAFDRTGLMVDADVVEGEHCADLFDTLLAQCEVEYLHAHTARRGCYLARVDRASARRAVDLQHRSVDA